MASEAGCGEGRRRSSIGARRNPETEAAILDAARAVLAERGYAGFSIDAVARRAGAGKPTIYRWWGTKADLLIDVYGLEADAAVLVPDTGALKTDLEGFGLSLWRFWRTTVTGGTLSALIAEAQTSPAALTALRSKFLASRSLAIRHVVELAIARQEITRDQAEILIRLFIGVSWFHLLTGTLDDEPALLSAMAMLATGATKSSLASAGEEG